VPEILEVEAARLLLAERALGRPIAVVEAPDSWYLKRGLTPRAAQRALSGHTLVAARRRGKQLFLDTRDGPVLGLHLGMSGRVLVDGHAAGDPYVYASDRDVVSWRRFSLVFDDGGRLAMRDPRRLGAVELDPDEDRLGVDAFSLTLAHLRAVVSRRRAPLKAVIMDQAHIAGLGNLLADEILWRAGLDPARPADSLDAAEQVRLARAIRNSLQVLGRRGGSHTGDLMAAREPGGCCPRDGTPLARRQVGGRTTYSCPTHQV
jgi:formamidopyrimidine-DNA glycosylase